MDAASRKVRTFVFVSNIPPFLLEPLAVVPGASYLRGRASRRDARYELLRRLLADHTSGVMLVMHLETRGYALALYASYAEALEACKTVVTPSQPGHTHPPLRLRLLERETPPPPEAVYSATIDVEGEPVAKAVLAPTRGLELAYRGRRVPKWCPNTVAKEDCPWGTSCFRVHLVQWQTTVRKRPRDVEAEGQPMGAASVPSPVQLQDAVPEALRLPVVEVPLSDSDAADLLASRVTDDLVTRVDAALAHRRSAASGGPAIPEGPVFAKLSIPGSAPWDWVLTSSEGLAAMRASCPLPANGAPTPLERDLFCQKMLTVANRRCRFGSVRDALVALTRSQRSRRALQQQRQLTEGRRGQTAAPVALCITPWMWIPTVAFEARVFLEVPEGAAAASGPGASAGPAVTVRGLVQRRDRIRLMKASAFVDDDLRYAVLGSGADMEAEALLSKELAEVGKLFSTAAEQLLQHFRRCAARTDASGGTSGPALLGYRRLCLNMAIAAPVADLLDGDMGDGARGRRAVVLSASPAAPALEDCFLRRQMAGVAMQFNTTKHPYGPMFSREDMELLRAAPP